jgi:hypothetical protein
MAVIVGAKIPVGMNYVEAELAADASTSSPVPAALFAAPPITTGGGALLVTFFGTFSTASLPALVNFMVMVDGVLKKSIGITTTGVGLPTQAALLAKVTGVAAGAHVVEIFWATAAGTAQIRPITASGSEQASVMVQEVP